MKTTKAFLLLALCFLVAINRLPQASAQSVTPSTAVDQPAAATIVRPMALTPAGTLQTLHGERLTYFSILTLVVGYLATTLIGAFGFIILWRMFKGRIDLSLLISESDGAASLSRFQFLVFTFVISLSLLLVILGGKDGPNFPETIPVGIYALLGISAASYVMSKSIQSGADKARDENYRVPLDHENAG